MFPLEEARWTELSKRVDPVADGGLKKLLDRRLPWVLPTMAGTWKVVWTECGSVALAGS